MGSYDVHCQVPTYLPELAEPTCYGYIHSTFPYDFERQEQPWMVELYDELDGLLCMPVHTQ